MIPRELLRSPTDAGPLHDGDGALVSSDGRLYPIVGGVPVLIDNDLSVFSVEEVVGGQFVEASQSLRRAFVRKLIPSRSLSFGTAQRYASFARQIQETTEHGRVLVIGGGKLGSNMSPLFESGLEIIESDVYLSPRVDVVCDGHNLPFVDEAFDGIVMQAVLEHVLDPVRVVSEAHRVLKPAGLIYAESPFLQGVHEGAFDFTRWTELGHRRLFRMFKELDRGVVAGPGTALLWSIRYFARALPRRRGKLPLILDKLATAGFFWVTVFDLILIKHPGATDGASGTYFVGQKSSDAVDDDVLLASYAGSVGRPFRRGA